jgi:PPE-repeat protein
MSQDLENLVRDFNSLKSLKTGENSNIELEIIITNGKSSGVTAGQYKTIMDLLTNKNAVVNTQYMVDKIHSNVANAGVKNNTFRLTMNYIKKPDGAGYSLKNTVKMNKKRFPPIIRLFWPLKKY